MIKIKRDLMLLGWGGVLACTLILVFSVERAWGIVQITSTPTLELPLAKATMEIVDRLTQEAAPKTPRPETLFTATPGLWPSPTPYYGNCPPRVAGDGLIFSYCAAPGVPWPDGLRKYGIFNFWVKQGSGETLRVYAGKGALTIYSPGTYPNGSAEYYLTPIRDEYIEITGAQGSQLILRSLSSQQQLYFDVDQRQFLPSLPTLTPTPTSTFTPTSTSTSTRTPTPTRTSTPTRTLTPTPKPTQYPATLQGLRRMLRDLNQRDQVNDGIYRALDVILISAARQVAHDNEFVAIIQLRAFIKIVDAQSGKQIKPEAAQQLTTHAYKVMEKLRDDDDDHRDDD